MFAAGLVFLALCLLFEGYLIGRFIGRSKRPRQPFPVAAKTAGASLSDTLPMPQNKHGVKTAKCPNCGQRTIADAIFSCQWCGYPLTGLRFKETKEKPNKPKEPKLTKERPVQVRTPFLASSAGRLIVVVLCALLLGGTFYGLVMTDALDDVLGDNEMYLQSKAIVNPPKPVVISESAYVTRWGDDYNIVVRGVIKNDGGTGRMMVNTRLTIAKQSFVQKIFIHINSGDTMTVDTSFPEDISPWLRTTLRTLFEDLQGASEELVHPDIEYEVWAEGKS